ncbi:hypothetical protein PVL29_016567 [Vitis rotundifolia]|uniref:Uncharacterized protein n=1 Tax=Vitis rotundifolia TaxID=103349 RepID=A0AA38Z8D4_VITRO|nr:hypothetical protein PVL29_016567 [Vitis rotundifolia]
MALRLVRQITFFQILEKAEEGYVKGVVTYMVTDALVVKPLSTMSIVDLLNKPNINEVGGELEETVVDFTMLEGLKLLMASMQTKQSLANGFLCKILFGFMIGFEAAEEAWLCEIFFENIAYTIAKKE